MEKLKTCLPEGQIRTQEPMNRHTTFRVGGLADFYTEPASVPELEAILALCRKEKMPFYILGNGSNLLVADSGYRGVMVSISRGWSEITVYGSQIRAGAGALLSQVAKKALQASLTGLEFAAGIPGSVGGAVMMNAGAYGSDMSAVLTSATVLDLQGKVLTIPATDLELGYRSSCIQKRGYVVLEAVFLLEEGDADKILGRMEELAKQRRSKQPLEYPSAGSTFKRPAGYFAGKLIQDAGLRGYSVGGAQVSEKHCGFVVNRGDATADDVMKLCRDVRQKVLEQFGVELELEVETLGDFNL